MNEDEFPIENGDSPAIVMLVFMGVYHPSINPNRTELPYLLPSSSEWRFRYIGTKNQTFISESQIAE